MALTSRKGVRLLPSLIRLSSGKGNSAKSNFALTEFLEVRMLWGLSLTAFAYSARLRCTASVVA